MSRSDLDRGEADRAGGRPSETEAEACGTPITGCRPTRRDLDDLVAAHLAGEFSEGFLREMLWDLAGMTGDETRALWFDAVERGMRLADRYHSGRNGPAGVTPAPPGSSPGPASA